MTSEKFLLDPDQRSWYYDGYGVKRDRITHGVIDGIKSEDKKATEESNQTTEQQQSKD